MTPRSLRALRSLPRYLACRLMGYEVVVLWGNELKAHWALTRAEAREWVDCYARVPGARARVWAAPLAAYYRPPASPFSR